MFSLELDLTVANVEALNSDLKAAVALCDGFVWNGQQITVYFTDKPSVQEIEQVTQIVQTHDPIKMTSEQLKELADGAELDRAKAEFTPIDAAAFKDPQLAELAKRIRFLELMLGLGV